MVPKGRTPCVDDIGIGRPDVLDVDLHFLARTRQEIGQENIRLPGEFIEELATFRMDEIDPDAALAAVGVLHQKVDRPGVVLAAHLQQPTLAVSTFGVLHLQHIRTPVRQDRTRCRNEGKLSHLQHSNAFHH